MALLGKMTVLFLFMLIGFFCRKKGYLDEKASQSISFLVVNFASPGLVISGTVNAAGRIGGSELFQTVLTAVFLYVGLIGIACFLPLLLRVPREQRGVYRLMTIFSNIGFMGFPVVQAMYGNEAMLQTAIFQIPYNLLIYTYGIWELTRGREGAGEGFAWRRMLNMGVAAALAAILLYGLDWETPQFFKDTVAGLGNLTAPLSMIVIGMALAGIPLRSLFTDVRLLVFSAVKLLVLPVIGMAVLKQFVSHETLRGVAMVMMATPVGSMTAMMAKQYGGDTELTSRGVALTTLLSVLTIPAVGALTL